MADEETRISETRSLAVGGISGYSEYRRGELTFTFTVDDRQGLMAGMAVKMDDLWRRLGRGL